MRRRLYFLLPDVESTRKTVDQLLLARIGSDHMHVLAKEGTALEGLPEADLLQRSDIVHGFELGIAIGGGTGALAGIVASLILTTAATSGGLILVCAITGALLGAWVSSMVGSGMRNSRLYNFESAIAQGEVLLMVDTPKDQIEPITQLVKKQHPAAHTEGIEPTIPAFP